MADLLCLATPRLELRLESTADVLARIDGLPPEHRAQVSEAWIAHLRSQPLAPWTHGFAAMERTSGRAVGSAAFKGAPDADGAVEIAYLVEPDRRGQGFAKEAASALVGFAFGSGIRVVRAHTLPERRPSTGVLAACGFAELGEVTDPEDGAVWRWERRAP